MTPEMPTIGHVVTARIAGDIEMPNGPIDPRRFKTLGIDEDVWRALEEDGLAAQMSLLATGFVNRHEDGAIEEPHLEMFIQLIEGKIGAAQEPLSAWLRAVRDLAVEARTRRVPVLFYVD